MYEFIRVQYLLGKITKQQVWEFAGKYITMKEAEEITK